MNLKYPKMFKTVRSLGKGEGREKRESIRSPLCLICPIQLLVPI